MFRVRVRSGGGRLLVLWRFWGWCGRRAGGSQSIGNSGGLSSFLLN
jgi:hypothetical protein